MPQIPPARIDFRRYRKVRRFVTRTFIHVLWWDMFLNVPGLRRFRPPAVGRWSRIARRYRHLAGEMGGVLIKLGQFLSVRVDLLPAEVTRELAGLQDEVPPERFEDIVRQIESDFGRPLLEVFSWVSPEPVGAASLAQVHPARLLSGEPVVVKVLRPGIDVLVETDLAAARLAFRLLKVSRKLRRRVDLGRLAEEITVTTRRELDLANEGRNAERFAQDFADDPRVAIPRVVWSASARRTLTLENVGYLKIADLAAIERAGISRPEVARVLYRIYMQQIFVHHFVHSDPHPGNLFVRPLPLPGEAPIGPGDPVPESTDRPFQIVFVDFGMVAAIPDHLQGALREYAIALGTRDASRLVQSYVSAGVLLPGADLVRLEEIHEELFRRFWGVSIGSLRDVAFSEAGYFFREYRDLLYEIPFQVQVDLLFASRAVGLLAGMTTQLDPEFDPWAETVPFAERLAREELRLGWRELLGAGTIQLQALLGLPSRFGSLISRIERGTLTVQSTLAPEARKTIQRLDRSIRRASWMIAASALLISGVMLRIDRPEEPAGRWLLALSALTFLWGVLARR
ncbi:MAG TPA: AarF/UbiB family protein [Thermoanaerobaculia bacterium]|jgi:predicted unusual protein kinase regulating ubiquinone biosynthesis (AarF/ABC1/UbiB family)|nr:AarF/UbiB family protein [Thermoanaerobaculia bacterium]